MNSNNTKVAAFFAKPTTVDGTLKQRLWTTLAHNLIVDETLKIESTDSLDYTYTYNDISYVINSDVLAARALYEAIQGAGTGLDDLLSVMSAGYLNSAQRTAATATTTTKKPALNPVAKSNRVLTAAELESNYIKLSNPDLVSFYKAASDVSDKSTKVDLLKLIKDLMSQLVNSEQAAHINRTLALELEEAAKYKDLSDIGYTSITRLSDDRISVNISAIDFANNAIVKTLEKGYKVVGDFKMLSPTEFSLFLIEGVDSI